tara:strand:+ start:258 stop:863 length:606 start_codon:yes stop_codon:yes gene_type:complete
MMALIFFDRQHAGKPGSKVGDRGAQADLDGDGKIESHEREAMLTPRYLLYAEERLLDLGHDVITLSDGWYSERHNRVNRYSGLASGKQVYVAAHLNAGGGNYGAVFYDHRSVSGPRLARDIALKLKSACPEIEGGVKVIPAKPDDWTSHAFNTIRNVHSPVSVCFEPCFVDNDIHHVLLTDDGLSKIGRALADGIHSWLGQ